VGFLLLLQRSLLLLLDFVPVALDDRAGDGADVLILANVLCLGRIVAILI
jgi:hypothetical protein